MKDKSRLAVYVPLYLAVLIDIVLLKYLGVGVFSVVCVVLLATGVFVLDIRDYIKYRLPKERHVVSDIVNADAESNVKAMT